MNIPCERILQQYWDEDGDFRTAFLRWGTELLEGYDRAVARGVLEVDETDCDREDAIAAALELRGPEQVAALREILKPQHRDGTTARILADRHHLRLPLVVSALSSPAMAPNADGYANMEDELVAKGVTDSWVQLNLRHGLSADSRINRDLAERHGVEVPAERVAPQQQWADLRREGTDLVLSGLSAGQALAELQRRHPDDERMSRLSVQAVQQWGKRARRRQQQVAA